MSSEAKFIPKRPYLLRAMYEWIVDNGMTPHILVDARSNQVSVPRQYVKDGNIVLNISPTATNNLMMRNDEVTFSARFGGKAFSIWLPMWSVMAIYARETQEWVSFPPEEYSDQVVADDQTQTVVEAPVLSLAAATASADAEINATEPTTDGDEPPPAPKPTTKARPSLRVVK